MILFAVQAFCAVAWTYLAITNDGAWYVIAAVAWTAAATLRFALVAYERWGTL